MTIEKHIDHSEGERRMTEYFIEKHEFDKKKEQLKAFTDQNVKEVKLSTFDTSGGLFGWFDHKVTGDELNDFVSKLQENLQTFIERDKKIFEEFNTVYETFDTLDTSYIQGILVSVEAAKTASAEAKEAQEDLSRVVDTLQHTIDKLKEFKEEVNQYEHLEDIDSMWADLNRVNQYEHLKDIDSMWADLNRDQETAGAEKRNGNGLYIAYAIAGSALVISIIQMAMQILGVW